MKKANLLYWIVGAALAVLFLISYGVVRKEGFAGGEGVPTFTMYYADWCPHCKTIKPAFVEFSKTKSVQVGKKTVFLDMVEADTDAEKLKGKPVKGFPTFLLETPDGKFKEFDGERNPDGWLSFLKENV